MVGSRGTLAGLALLGLATASPAQEPPPGVEHVVVRAKTQASSPFVAGFLEVMGDRLVIGGWHGGSSQLILIAERATGTTVVDLRDKDPNSVCCYPGGTLVVRTPNAEKASLLDVRSGTALVDLQGLIVASGKWLLTCDNGHAIHRDPKTGAVTADLDAGQAFRDTGAVSLTPDGVWIFSRDMRRGVRLSQKGRETGRYELPAAEAAQNPTINVQDFDSEEEGAIVLSISNVAVDAAGNKGTIFRLLDGARPKDLAVRGARPKLSWIGRLSRDSRLWIFERQRKRLGVLDARADGAMTGDADTWLSVDLKRWKIAATMPRPASTVAVNDRGYVLTGTTVLDVGDGKVVGERPAGDAKWLELSERYAFAWDQEAQRLDIYTLTPFSRREVSLPDATSLRIMTHRRGDDAVLLEGRGPGRTQVTRLIPATGEHVPMGEVPCAVERGEVARGDGRLWAIVPEGASFHVFGIPEPE